MKQEIEVIFAKYKDPIYVKLEKLDIMIRLESHATPAQVLAEQKAYATEVDAGFVCQAVWGHWTATVPAGGVICRTLCKRIAGSPPGQSQLCGPRGDGGHQAHLPQGPQQL